MNEPIRTLLVDDEPMSLATLRFHAANDPELDIVGEAANGADAVRLLRTLRPELVLLDVQMPVRDGFEVLADAGGDPAPAVVFVTAFDEYAVRAFEVAAADFLLKPFDAQRFQRAVGRAKDEVYRSRAQGEETQPGTAAPLGERGDTKTHFAERLLIRENGRIHLLPVAAITWVESAANYVKIYTRERMHVVRMKISDLEAMLDPSSFARIHRTRIVNLHRITSMRPLVNGSYMLTLKDGTEIRMSRMFAHNVLGSYGSRPGATR